MNLYWFEGSGGTVSAFHKKADVDDELTRLRERVGELERHETSLMDRLDKINRICWDNKLTGPAKLAQVKDWSGGYAPVPPDPNATDDLAPLIAEAVKPTPIRVSDPPCRNERDGKRCTLELHHDGDHEYE